jgi:hypothetical protein
MNHVAKIYRDAFLFLLTIGLSSCVDRSNQDHTENENAEQWTDARIDATISSDSVFSRLNRQKELFSILDRLEEDSLALRSSDVSYHSGLKLDLSDTAYAKFNNCRAYYLQSDTLLIDIGSNEGFGGYGFVINYKNRKFYTEPYLYSDIPRSDGEPWPAYEIIYQTLTLDKPVYAVGDSLYGNIEFVSIETNEGRIIKHFGKGHFRAKVLKQKY